MPNFRGSSFFAVAALVVACSHSSNGSSPDSSSGDDSGAGGDSDVVSCQSDPRVDTYVANLTKASASGAVKVTLVKSEPGPPIRGSNDWTVRVTDGSGAPVANPNLTVSPFMPDHGHGTSIVAAITAQPDGSYLVSPLYLFMPGVWRVTFAVSVGADASAPEQVSFYFCVAG